MKYLLYILTLLIIIPGAVTFASVSTTQSSNEEFRQTYQLLAGAVVSVNNIAGRITIKGWNEKFVEVHARKHSSRVRDDLRRVHIEIIPSASRLEINTTYEQGRNSIEVDYDLMVPTNVSIGPMQSVSGDIQISNINGRVSASAASGDITASNIAGSVDVSSASGEVTVDQVTGSVTAKSASGTVRVTGGSNLVQASSVSGDVFVRGASGRVDARSVSGDIKLEEMNSAAVDADTSVGDVFYSGALLSNGRYVFQSRRGTVTAVITTQKCGFRLTARSFNGDIKSDFPLQVSGMTGIGSNNHRIEGVNGDGCAKIEASSFNGNINILNSAKSRR